MVFCVKEQMIAVRPIDQAGVRYVGKGRMGRSKEEKRGNERECVVGDDKGVR